MFLRDHPRRVNCLLISRKALLVSMGGPTGQQPTYWDIVDVITVSAKIDDLWGRSMAHMSGA